MDSDPDGAPTALWSTSVWLSCRRSSIRETDDKGRKKRTTEARDKGCGYPTLQLYEQFGLVHLGRLKCDLSRAKACVLSEPDAGNLHVRFDERGVETASWPGS